MLIRFEDFLRDGLPELLKELKDLRVFFGTYNAVRGYPDGMVDTKKPGLNIQVQSGNLSYSSLTLAACWGGLMGSPVGSLGVDLMHAEGHEAQSALQRSLKIEKVDEVPFLAFIYAGVSAFDDSVEMARQIHKEHPQARIVITTCDCHQYSKERALQPLLQSGEIIAAVVTYECGGRDMMADILKKTIELWPEQVTA